MADTFSRQFITRLIRNVERRQALDLQMLLNKDKLVYQIDYIFVKTNLIIVSTSLMSLYQLSHLLYHRHFH